MKTSRVLTLVGLALIAGFLVSHLSTAQPALQPPSKAAVTDDAFALRQLESFVTYLQDTKQTNVLKRFGDYSDASIVSEKQADMGVTTAILVWLRDGHTNEAIHILETRLTGDAVGFAASYRELPGPVRETVRLATLEHARDYYRKFHVKENQPDVDQIVANAFKLLDEKTGK
jgi:hypothetical protein